ncbi:MAG: TIGR04282 family arsenosugar biosynthesis glycosyltransferase [Saprospiraceae bacterium]|nr:TIGR04282 family arsenosugar biosynthesis glycosyltransferase [Saprospiraceae bacterium]
MEDRHLIVFVKNPVLGEVKTRLAASLGEQRALDIYNELLAITRENIANLGCQKHVFFGSFIEDDVIWEEAFLSKNIQDGGGLGERMESAFYRIFRSESDPVKAVLIGSDCPELTSVNINQAFELLDTSDVVLGPALDGGYYLIGMKKNHPAIWLEIDWSTDRVYQQTIDKINKFNLSYSVLPVLQDIDTQDDWSDYLSRRGEKGNL